MIKGILLLSLAMWTSPCHGQELLQNLDWRQLEANGAILSGRVEETGVDSPAYALRISNPKEQAKTFPILVVRNPGIHHGRYAVRGLVSGGGIEKIGYLEMWSVFADGSRFFTRALAPHGPMKRLENSFDWRPFELPFLSREEGPHPVRLEINLILESKGTVRLSSLTLVGYGPDTGSSTPPPGWWAPAATGWILGLAGALIGLFGMVAGRLATKGRAQGLVIGGLWLILGLGGILLIAAVFSLFRNQPYLVFFPLLLLGVVCLALAPLLLVSIKKRFRALELQKMKALDSKP